MLLALPSLLVLLVQSHDSLETIRFLDAGITLGAIVCFLLGAAGMRLGSGAGAAVKSPARSWGCAADAIPVSAAPLSRRTGEANR